MKHRPLESTFQRKVLKKLKSLRRCQAFKISDRLKSGIPDVLMCLDGKFLAMELKRDEKSKPTAIQKHTLEQIKQAGGHAFVVSPENWDEIWERLVSFAGALE